jgi:hypothetical protein
MPFNSRARVEIENQGENAYIQVSRVTVMSPSGRPGYIDPMAVRTRIYFLDARKYSQVPVLQYGSVPGVAISQMTRR